MTKRLSNVQDRLRCLSGRLALLSLIAMLACELASAPLTGFQIDEASIVDIHTAIKSGQTTCRAIVQSYIERAKAYNGICTALVTADGVPIPATSGAIRAGAPTKFPTTTVPVTSLFPAYADYAGLPLE